MLSKKNILIVQNQLNNELIGNKIILPSVLY